MSEELIPLSSLLNKEEEKSTDGLIPLSSFVDDSVNRVPTAMDRGTDLPANAPVAQPQRDLGFFGKAGERLRLGFEQGDLDQEAYRIMSAGGGGFDDYLKRRKEFQRRSSAADIKGDNWFSQGFYGAAQMIGPMVQGTTEGLGYGTALGATALAAGQLGPQVAVPEELVTVPVAAAAGMTIGSSQYWYRQGAGSLYADLREEGVPHDVAAPVSQSMGVPYALIEYAQVSKVAPGMKRFVKQKIAEKVKSALKRNTIQFGSDVTANVGQEVAQEITMAAGEAIAESISDVDMKGTPFGERLLETTGEMVKVGPWILAPGRMAKTAVDVSQEQKVKELNDFLAKGNTAIYRDRYTNEQAKQLIDESEELDGLKGHNGRVIMFERVPEIKEGEPLGTTHEYIKVDDTNSDLTTLIEQHENANPNSYYRGAFDLGTVEVAEKPDSLETRIETEATALGDGVLDPIRLGKHRVKAKDVQTVLGGEVTDSESGYDVKLDNGIELKIDFTEMQGDVDVQSYLSETGMEQSEWDALSKEEQDEKLQEAVTIGAFTKNSVIDAEGNTVEIPDSYLMQLGAGVDIGTFRHEAIHFLRETGLMTEKEYQTLVSKYSRSDRDEIRQEEDVARAYEYYVKRGGDDGIFKRLYDKFTGMLNIRSAASILRRVDRGEVGMRDKPEDTLEPVVIPLPDDVESEVEVGEPDVEPSSEIKYSVQDKLRGVNVRNEADARFADLIVDGKKTVETRNTDSLRAAVGQRIRITRTGEGDAEYIGEATVGEPVIYNNEKEFRSDAKRHLVQPGSGFDIQQGGIKYGYPMLDAERYAEPIPAPRVRGRVMSKPEAARQSVRNVGSREFVDMPMGIVGTGKGGSISTKDVANALEELSLKLTGEKFNLESEEDRQIAQAMVNALDEVTYQLQQPDSGVDWYEADIKYMDKALVLAYEAMKKPEHMTLFKALLAPTSYGTTPMQNFATAARIYEAAGGSFNNLPRRQPDGKGWTARGDIVEMNMDRISLLVNQFGEKGAAKWLKTKHPVRELRQYNKHVSGHADEMKYGAHIFGPKGGPFFLNLNGISQEMTKDLWFSRSWNRLMGTAFDDKGNIVEAPRNDTERERMDAFILAAAERVGLTPSEFQAVWWYYEQQLWAALGANIKSYSYKSAAEKLLNEKGIKPPRIAKGRSAAAKRRQDAVDAAIFRDAGYSEKAIRGILKRPAEDRPPVERRIGRPGDEVARFIPRTGNRGVRKLRSDLKDHVGTVFDPSSTEVELSKTTPSGRPTYTGPVVELKPKSGKVFRKLILEAKKGHKHGSSVYAYKAAEYSKMRLFISPDGKSGIAVKPDGDMVSVFSNTRKGASSPIRSLLNVAVAAGAKKADAFNTVLPGLYADYGFEPVARLPWDDSQAPADWDKATYQLFNNGQPDVVFLAYKGGEPLTLGERAGTFEIKDPSEIPYSESYDEALAAQESAVVEQRVPPPRLSVRVSPKARERINVIEGYEAIEAEDVEEVNNSTVNSIIKQAFGRKSRQIVYFGGQATLRAKQKLELEEAYAARAVRKTVEELHRKLVNDAWDSQTGYKLPKWFRVGAWSRRLKKFYKLALPIAAHLNAVGRNEDGTFNFTDFEMRAGMMPLKEFKKQGHEIGNIILVKDEVTGEMDELIIANHIVADGRQGYQLIRKMSAEQQGEIYDHFANEFPDMIWAVDQFIDPALRNTRTVINGVEVPAFNRFSLEFMMGESDVKEGDKPMIGIAGYTPDVIVSRSLLGALKGVFNPRAGSRSPGRKYKTGTSREGEIAPEYEEDEVSGKPVFAGYTRKGGDLRGLFEGFSIRAYQAIREKARKEYFENIIRYGAKPIKPGEKLLPDHKLLETGISDVWDAIQAFQNFEGIGADSELEKRLSKKAVPSDIKSYSKFIGEALKRRGKQYQIDKRLIKLLEDGYAAEKVHNWLIRAGAWAIRNSTQTLLAHPFTYVINVLSNDMFTAEAIAKNTTSGLLKLASLQGKAGVDDLRFAKNLFTSQFYKFAAIRKMVGWKTEFDQFAEEIMPDDVFEGSTALEDLKIQHHVKPWEYLRQGEIGAAALQAIQYGNIDIRAKQRSTYAFLKAKAVRRAKDKGLSGEALKIEVASYMARPPKQDRIQAMELADFDYLNYSDSPNFINFMAGTDYSRLLMPFPRFAYHWSAKQLERASALKLFIGKVPKGKRADALANLTTLLMFTGGGAFWVLDKVLRGGEDDDEARERIGTATYKYIDPVTGEMKSKRLPRELITANRINLSEYFRLLGIDDDDDSDFWWRARQFPPVVMAGAIVLAEQDAKKAYEEGGASAAASTAVRTYFSQGADLLKDFFTLGGGVKVVEKVYDTTTTEPGDRPPTMITDPYASNVPLSFYVMDQTMTTLVPGRRQFDEVMMFIDPTSRRKTRSKVLDYEPGAWEAVRLGHASGVVDRVLNKFGLTELPMAQGTVKEVAKKPVRGEKKERKALRSEAKQILAEGRPEARQFRDRHGNLRLGLIPEATRTTQQAELQALKLGGFNIRQYPRAEYQEALQPPEYAR